MYVRSLISCNSVMNFVSDFSDLNAHISKPSLSKRKRIYPKVQAAQRSDIHPLVYLNPLQHIQNLQRAHQVIQPLAPHVAVKSLVSDFQDIPLTSNILLYICKKKEQYYEKLVG